MRCMYQINIIVFSMLVMLVPMHVEAQSANSGWVSDALIKKALDGLGDFYADVPSAINCSKAKKMAEKLICGNPYLAQAELLNTRAQAYAIENATKRQVEHQRFRGEIPIACTNEACIYDYFRNQTNASLGGDSPYYVP